MKTCKNCQWWTGGICDFVDTIDADNPDTGFHIEAEADDDQGLTATLHTAPNFGCVNFKGDY